MQFRNFLLIFVVGINQQLIASGGPSDALTYECTGGGSSLILLKLEEAYSSEMRGYATAYDDKGRRGFPKTSADSCRELRALINEHYPAVADAQMICGTEKPSEVSRPKIQTTKSGFRFLIWLGAGHRATKARLEVQDGSTYRNVYDDLNCRVVQN
ncbi:MAG: hypothetical protein KBD78_13430 [Oligoflexales bacterium]|nr:hypothetical protein [Oligoflexales bacterium]